MGENDTYGIVYGGYYANYGEVSNNVLTINSGTFNSDVSGGLVDDYLGLVSNNTLIINGGTFNSDVSGSYISGSLQNVFIFGERYVKNNTLIINNGIFNGDVYGGYFGWGYIKDNTITINGGTFNGNIYSAYGGGTQDTFTQAYNNVINISGTPDLSNSVIYGMAHDGGALNIYTKNLSAKNIADFQNINFYLPESTVNGDTILTLSESSTDISGAVVKAGVMGNANLNNGDVVTLLTNAGTITTDGTTYGKLTEGISLTYDLTVKKDGDNKIIATIGSTNTDDSNTDDTNTDNTNTDDTNTDNTNTDTSNTDDSNTDNSNTDNTNTDDTNTDTSNTDDSNTDNSNTDNSNTDDTNTDNSNTDDTNTDNTNTDDTNTDNTNTDTSNTDDSNTDNSNTDNSNTDNTNTDDTPVVTPVDDSNNVVNVYSSDSGNLYGGNTDTGNASNNTVNLYGGTNLENIYGGYAPNGSTSGNVLNVYNKNISAQNVLNFDSLNFYIPNDAVNGDTMLTLTDSSGTDLSGVSIRAGVVAGNKNLTVGNTINLLTNSNGLITNSATNYGRLTEGVSLDYGLNISNSGNSIVATVNSSPNSLNPQTESLPLSSGVTGVSIVENVMETPNIPEIDFDSDEGETNAAEFSEVVITEPAGWEIFANMGGGSLRTKAGNGAYVDMTSTSINLGFARSLEASSGRFTIAPIIDYAHGNYDSYLIDGTHGSGSTKYIAGGLIARRILENGFYYETSFRAGRVKTDFSSSNIDKTGAFGTVTYNTSATALSGHLKLGKALRLNRNNLLDVYATYYHAHQGSMDAHLSSGEHYNFSSANSGRFRIGYKLTTRASKISKIYTGLAYQYEHSSGITATYKGYETPSAGESGSSGMLEVGWIIKPLKVSPWAVDINATGWVGHQRGVTAMAKIQKAF